MNFEFASPDQILFGWGSLDKTASLAKSFGRKALVVLGGSGRWGDVLTAALSEEAIASVTFSVVGEPKVATVEAGVSLARSEGCDLVIAVGGGSVIDAGKAIAGMATQMGSVLDHLEVVGGGKPLTASGLPFIAVPSTAGTGAEVTRNAVLEVPEHKVKVSLRSRGLLPRVAIVDPALTQSLPPEITAQTGMDALTQLIEPFVGVGANPMTDGFCREGVTRVARSLEHAYRDGSARSAREDMSVASLLGGLALANAKLGAVHGLAGVLGATLGQPHGAICARLLPLVMAANLDALERRLADSPALPRYGEVARILTGDPSATARDGVQWVANLVHGLGIPSLPSPASQERDVIVAGAQRASSMKGNPLSLTDDELREILIAAAS